ncbi:hypothetical protein H4W19_01540 [Pseudoxanthomonas mexicana]|uniref:Transmembrane protein n=1 Tax=Pseudoxanthomonas mexicana TaxID=128785 RepID=A0ABX6RBV5_PSEMX|nr:hypothetical protein [Pseudoxanthomonas mexicana]QND80516.1 hypothetical protein H4W19_01540 [Pseudoxanthomonas mexicana]
MDLVGWFAIKAAAGHAWWEEKSGVHKLYLGASAIALAGVTLFMWHPESDVAGILGRVGFTMFALAYLREAYLWTIPKLELPLVKLAIAALGVMAAAAATGVSRMAVNDATGQDPAHFATTVTLLVPISFVPVVAATVSVGGIIVVLATIFWTLLRSLWSWTRPADLDLLLGGVRVFSCLVIIGAAASILKSSSPLFPTMSSLASYSAYLFDAQPNSACGPAPEDRVLRLNDELVIVARTTTDGLQFVRRACNLVAEDSPLRDPTPVAKPRLSPNPS